MAKDPDDRFQTPGELAETLTTGTVVARVRRRRRRRRAIVAARAAAVAAVLGLVGWWITASSGPDFERLAVLPLVDLTNDPEQEYLASGVHEALIVELGRLGLSVTARRTMARYRDTEKGIREIAEELGVDGVIEGSVFRQGDSLEIATRLYDKDEQEIWTASFDGVLPNIVSLYRGFARAIAGQIQLSLRPADEARLGEATPVNPEVYEAYLMGMHIRNNIRRLTDAEQAVEHFNRAVEQNPADPLAYAGLAVCYATLGHSPDPPPNTWPLARAAAERAIRLDSTSAEGWAALADYKSYSERDWAGAERAFRRANELNPSLAMNHYHYAWYLALFGRVEEALSERRLSGAARRGNRLCGRGSGAPARSGLPCRCLLRDGRPNGARPARPAGSRGIAVYSLQRTRPGPPPCCPWEPGRSPSLARVRARARLHGLDRVGPEVRLLPGRSPVRGDPASNEPGTRAGSARAGTSPAGAPRTPGSGGDRLIELFCVAGRSARTTEDPLAAKRTLGSWPPVESDIAAIGGPIFMAHLQVLIPRRVRVRSEQSHVGGYGSTRLSLAHYGAAISAAVRSKRSARREVGHLPVDARSRWPDYRRASRNVEASTVVILYS